MGDYDVDFEVDFPEGVRATSPDSVAFAAMESLPVLLRTHCIRICMFSSICKLSTDAGSIASAAAGASRALSGFIRLNSALTGRGPLPELHEEALAWMRGVADANAHTLPPLSEYGKRASGIVSALETGKPVDPKEIEALISYVYSTFHYAAVDLSDAIRAAHQKMLEEERERAEDARNSAQEAVDRIDTISRTVRLIALNAAVEAARAGDAGRGFSVIAQEIKSLSEATEEASGDVRVSLDGIMQNLRF
ncbi:MAG: methyl-accepting chemotaxis protein [Pseudomonadota bacterium]